MWDLPRPGLKPVSAALAGRFSTTAPPGRPINLFLISQMIRTFIVLAASVSSVLFYFVYLVLSKNYSYSSSYIFPFINFFPWLLKVNFKSSKKSAFSICSTGLCFLNNLNLNTFCCFFKVLPFISADLFLFLLCAAYRNPTLIIPLLKLQKKSTAQWICCSSV